MALGVQHAERAHAAPFAATRTAVADTVGPLRRALTRWTVAAGADQRTQEAVALAASEAITNVVVHAYRNLAEAGMVSVGAELLGSDRLRVTVSDQGGGMVPRPDSPGLGLGLPLIVQLTQSVDINSRPGRGTRIAMEFELLSGR